jgi:enolase-phosphatase E1
MSESSQLHRSIILDIEGTTTPISFVFETLFPYVRQHLGEFLVSHINDDSIRPIIDGLLSWAGRVTVDGLVPPEVCHSQDASEVARLVEWQMDRDLKTTELKELQGKIWKNGYANGKLLGEVFEDVPAALRNWNEFGCRVFIYSSGSEEAQRLLFGHTCYGDLTPLLSGYFDTTIGSKRESESYARIADRIQASPGDCLFVTDVLEEATAAQEAGLEAVISQRPGNRPLSEHRFKTIDSLLELG